MRTGVRLSAGASGVVGGGRGEGALTDVQPLHAQLRDGQHLCRPGGSEQEQTCRMAFICSVVPWLNVLFIYFGLESFEAIPDIMLFHL